MEFDFKKGGKIRPWNDSEPTLTQACGITRDLYSQLLRRLKKNKLMKQLLLRTRGTIACCHFFSVRPRVF